MLHKFAPTMLRPMRGLAPMAQRRGWTARSNATPSAFILGRVARPAAIGIIVIGVVAWDLRTWCCPHRPISLACSKHRTEPVTGSSIGSVVALGATAGSGASAPSSNTQLWLDLRGRSNAQSLEARIAAGSAALSDMLVPDVQAALLSLFAGVKTKLESLGIPMPQGQGVDGLLVEEEVALAVLEQPGTGGLPVFRVSDGSATRFVTPGGDQIIGLVYEAASGRLVGGLSVPPAAPWQTGPAREVKQVWGPDCYGEQAPAAGAPVARTLPQDPMLWATALMKRRPRAESRGTNKGAAPAYSLPSDGQ